MNILISHATVLCMDEANTVLSDGFVLVKGREIAYVGPIRPAEAVDREINGTGKVLMPGFVDCHTHLTMSLMRGYGGGHDLQTWLNDYIFPVEAKLDNRAVRAGTALALAEAISCGITSVSDMYYFCDDIIAEVVKSGISANIARGATVFTDDFDPHTYPACAESVALAETWHNYNDGQIKIDACIHGEYTSNPKLWAWMADFAGKYGLQMHVHLSETKSEHTACLQRWGKTPAAVFEEYGLWNTPAIAAHCVWTTPEDWEIFKRHGVTAVHNPASNMKLASGAAPAAAMLDAGVNVALGTDGMSSNDNHDMFEEMKLAALLARVSSMDPMALSDAAVLKMATVNGAKAQGRNAGVVKAGAQADLILVDFRSPNLQPCHDVSANLIYSAHGSNVCMNMARGSVIYENGNFLTLDLDEIYREVERYAIPKLFR
ncbi:MAG TPA: amidohydrolase [Firmicutes bacterium]|nr:amidohydrolase [Bacillota bacterium]